MATKHWKNKVGIYVLAVCAVLLLAFVWNRYRNAKAIAAKTVAQVFELSRSGSVTDADAKGLLSPNALTFLQSLGNKSGVFNSYQEGKTSCQLSGAPCTVDVTVVQGEQKFPLTMTLDGDWCISGEMNNPSP